MSIPYTNKINKHVSTPTSISAESHVVGIVGVATVLANYIRLVQVPEPPSPTSTVIIPGYNEIMSGSPTGTQFLVDYTNGTGSIQFDVSQNGNTVLISYKGLGSEFAAEDVNELQNPVGVALNLNGSLTNNIVKPASISNTGTDDFIFPRDVTANRDVIATTKTTTDLVKSRTGNLLLEPLSNSVTGVKLANATGTVILDVDTTNSRVGINNSSPTTDLDITGEVKATDFLTASISPASTGVLRLAHTDVIAWRNFAGSGDDVLASDGSDDLTWKGNVIATGAGAVTSAQGTANEVLVNGTSGSAQVGALTLTTPQAIGTTSTPTFADLTLTDNISTTLLLNNSGGATLTTAAGISTTLTGGSLTLTTGDISGNTGFTDGGSITLTTGAAGGGESNGGSLTLTTGNQTSGKAVIPTGGSITLTCGSDGSGTSDSGGNLTLTSFTPANSGNIILTGTGASHGNVSGNIFTSTQSKVTNTTNQLVLGVTNTTIITSPVPSASRIVTLPDAGTNSSFILSEGITQTINGTLVTNKDNATSFRLAGPDFNSNPYQSYAGIFYNNDYDTTGTSKTRVIFGANTGADLDLQAPGQVRLDATDPGGYVRIASIGQVELHMMANTDVQDTQFLRVGRVDEVTVGNANQSDVTLNNPNGSLRLNYGVTTGAVVLPSLTTTEQNALIPVAGMIVFNTSTNQFVGYNGSSWIILG